MTSVRRAPVPLGVWILIAMFTATALGAGPQVGTSEPGGAPADPVGPTAIEQALIEHACSASRTAGAPETAYQACLSAQFLSLRADLGRDLSRLSGSERRTLDSVCSAIRAAGRREAYVECLSAQLTSLRNRRKSVTPGPSQGTALAPPSTPSASPVPPARQAASWASPFWIGATIVALLLAVGGVLLVVRLLAVKTRPVPRLCRVCGSDVPESGDLCQPCRHEAAEAVRSAAMERAERQRAQLGAPDPAAALGWRAEQQPQQSELVEEPRLQDAPEEEGDARLRQEEDARERENARELEEAFDPCAVLGVPLGASIEDIGVAYQKAKLKYDQDQVAHLSAEVQEHYRAKADAVERALQELTAQQKLAE
jgi:hypothetical protein